MMGPQHPLVQETGADKRVMIVDDEVDLALSLTDILENNGYIVEMAHDGKGAIKKLKDFKAQVVLLDLRLGQENGISLISKFRQECSEILPIIMTAYAAAETAIEALQKGAYDYLKKPLNPNDLLATLDRCFDKICLERDKSIIEASLQKRNKELEEINTRLRESEERYRLLVETMNDGLVMLDERGIINYINDKLCEMVGFSHEELIGITLTEFRDEKSIKIYNMQCKRHIKGDCESYEIELLWKDGSILPTIASPQLILDSGRRCKGVFTVLTDLSERKASEKERITIENQLQQA